MIRVKFISRGPAEFWLHQLPHATPVWGHCEFVFDRDADGYDWLVVYDDVAPRAAQSRDDSCEPLACPPGNSILVTTEPSSIKVYGRDFTSQFGRVLTSQEAWALPHPHRIHSQPALHWFYGVGAKRVIPFDAIAAHPPLAKSAGISMVFSPKKMRHTLHRRRHAFMCGLMDALPEMAVYGRGARSLDDKAEALDAYRYHVAVENHIGAHHWTEKLADAFLGATLPFYGGCPNLGDYFPAGSFIPIDIRRPADAARIIRRAIADNEYEKRLPAILEARRRVLYEYNLFAVVARLIERHERPEPVRGAAAVLYSRHALRRRSLGVRVRDLYGKARVRAIHFLRRE